MFFRKSAPSPAPRPRNPRRLRLPQARPNLEALETRVVPYATSGNAWPVPQLISISFMPDGTFIASGNYGKNFYSNLSSYFTARFGGTYDAQWEDIILRAAQTWAQQTNINFTVVNDSGLDEGDLGAGYQQGDPNFGDIRVGGTDTTVVGDQSLANANYPPPVNNYSIAGDITYNTGQPFTIGSYGGYDLFTVSMHEFGHALGLAHASAISAIMYPIYEGAAPGLTSDDISGIRAIYGGARAPDRYDTGTGNGSFAAATNITSAINTTSLTAVVTGLDITTTADLDYYKFTAPANSAYTMTVTVQSSGLSLLTPKVTVYNASQVAVGSASVAPYRQGSSPLENGATLTLSNLALTPGATYYVKVQGVDTTAFSTGAYALTLNLGTGPNPTVPLPNTQVPNGDPLSDGGGSPDTPGQDTPGSDSGPDPAPGPAAAQTADANLVNGLVSRGAAGAVVAPASAAQSAAPFTTSQMAPPVTAPARGQVEAALVARVNGTTEEAVEQLSPPVQKDDSEPTPAPQAAPDAGAQPVAEPVTGDAWLAVRPEAPVEQAASAPAVAEATVGDWTPDGALAAASALFGGAWLRWHAAHQQDERRRHQSEVNEKHGAS